MAKLVVPNGATVKNLESANNLLIEETNGLILTLTNHLEKYKQRRKGTGYLNL